MDWLLIILTNTLFGVGSNNGILSNLYRISIATGNLTLIGPCNEGLINFACDTLGRLFSVSLNDNQLYSINKVNGSATAIGPIGFTAQYAQGMDVDRKTNICYMAAYNYDNSSGEMRTIDLTTGKTSLIGAFAGKPNIEITGLAIPYNGYFPAIDVGVTLESSPVSGCGLENEQVSVTVENMGNDTVNNIPVHYSVYGVKTADTILTGNLAPASFVKSYISETPANLSAVGSYIFKAYTTKAGDNLKTNDTLVFTVKHFAVSDAPYSMGFEPNEDFSSWAIIDANKDGFTWTIINHDAHNGNYCAAFPCDLTKGNNDWLFSKCLQLDVNKTYQLSFWDKCYLYIYPEAMAVWLCNAQNLTGPIQILKDYPNIINSDYQLNTINFTVPNSGVYYIGFKDYSYKGFILYLDDISISDVTGINETGIANHKLEIFPNPANSFININSSEIIKDVVFTNILGKTLNKFNINSNNATINISNISEGMYFIQIETANGISTSKLLISR